MNRRELLKFFGCGVAALKVGVLGALLTQEERALEGAVWGPYEYGYSGNVYRTVRPARGLRAGDLLGIDGRLFEGAWAAWGGVVLDVEDNEALVLCRGAAGGKVVA